MNLLLKQLIPSLIFFFFLAVAWSAVVITKEYNRRKMRRTPFTEKFLRGPGQSLMEKLQEINSEINAYLAMMMVTPVMLYATFIWFR